MVTVPPPYVVAVEISGEKSVCSPELGQSIKETYICLLRGSYFDWRPLAIASANIAKVTCSVKDGACSPSAGVDMLHYRDKLNGIRGEFRASVQMIRPN
ncbi:hypothetical protein K7X08_018796 [Anisodus acutangulus]|uniref:Uncharacterized protein n=1 Tax=Anisodus acutangulus TaxID=402998 RepID=A0A9Q1M144_9SOLA|nr:hypothetical protein K7X08_018796 [Anisodus acutangulus]